MSHLSKVTVSINSFKMHTDIYILFILFLLTLKLFEQHTVIPFFSEVVVSIESFETHEVFIFANRGQ